MSKDSEGQKKARKILDKFHVCLNSASLLPAQTYVPNALGFQPVVAVSQIIALIISKNYERIPFMIHLAYGSFSRFNGMPVYDNYRKIAFDYLCQVSYFLKSYSDLDITYLEKHIPKELLDAGEKNAPDFNVETQHFNNT